MQTEEMKTAGTIQDEDVEPIEALRQRAGSALHGLHVSQVAANEVDARSQVAVGQGVLLRPLDPGLGKPGFGAGEDIYLGDAVQKQLSAELAADASGAAGDHDNSAGEIGRLGEAEGVGRHGTGHPK